MMIRWMIYLGLLIFAAYESVVFEDAAVTMFFVAALLLFVLLLLLLLIQRQMLKVSMKTLFRRQRRIKVFNFFSDWRTDCRF